MHPPPPASVPVIAIVGGGPAGLASARALLRTGARVRLFGDPDTLAVGYAYGPAAHATRLNAHADRMGLDADAPAGFADWAGLVDDARYGFESRARYGDYLRAMLADAQARWPDRLEVIPARATGIARDGARLTLHDAHGGRHAADALVLATGTAGADRPRGVSAEAFADPAYLVDPLGRGLAGLPPDARVLLIGTGLTMVDCVTELQRHGHRGPLLAVSRRGLRPARHVPHAPPAPQRGWCDDAVATGSPTVRGLLRRFRAGLGAGHDWRALVDGLRAAASEVWRALPAAEQRRFQRHLAALWNVHRHRSPAPVAEQIDALLQAGRLELRRGRLQQLAPRPGGGFTAAFMANGQRWTAEADRVLQCIGLDLGLDRRDDPVLRDLLALGLVRPHPAGEGLDIEPSQRARPVSAGQPPVYTLGSLARGADPDQVAIPELRAAAARIANDWLQSQAR